MMEAILKQMLLGTSKLGAAAPPTGEVERLVSQARPPDAETRLLFEAGAWAVFGQAGRKPLAAGPLPEPAPADDKPVPSTRAARLLEEIFSDYRDLLPETLGRLCDAGLRLPDHLLPVALANSDKEYRPAIARTLGARGLWLSRFNPDWAWATATIATAAEGIPVDAEEIWDSGPIDQREALLRQIRKQDPARAREWLQKSWTGEKADNRERLLAVLETGLSREDEAFLEETLTDRAMRVRAQAASLLVRIDGSAFLGRIDERVDACLEYKAASPAGKLAARLKSLVGRKNEGELIASPPKDVEPAWKKEGLIPAPPQGVGPRAWWLSHMIALVPPAHWQERFGLDAAELLSTSIDEEWAPAVMTGWTQAALLHGARDWLALLWDHWIAAAKLRSEGRLMGSEPSEFLGPMLARMTPQESTPRIGELIRKRSTAPFPWFKGLEHLPRPWAPDVARAFLEQVRQAAKRASTVSGMEVHTLALAARALPPECFDEALQEWTIPEGDSYDRQFWRREVGRFTEVVLLRQRIVRAFTGTD
jgi:hypothetical protein